MNNRTLYNDNKPLKAAGIATLVLGLQILIGLSTGWVIVTILFAALAAPCAGLFVYYCLQWLKIQKMTDEEYDRYIEAERVKKGRCPKRRNNRRGTGGRGTENTGIKHEKSRKRRLFFYA